MIKIIKRLTTLEKYKDLWKECIDYKGLYFHNYSWIYSICSVYSGWKIYLNIENNIITGMVPIDSAGYYLGSMYTDYTEPFGGRDWITSDIKVKLPKALSGSSRFGSSFYSNSIKDIKNKKLSDLRRQRNKIKDYEIIFDLGNKLKLFNLFKKWWFAKWKWPEEENNRFEKFVSINEEINAAVLKINGEFAAIWLFLKDDFKLLFWVTARNPNIKYSCGLLLLLEIEKIFPEVIFDSGIGREEYKKNFFPHELRLYNANIN